MIKIENDKKEKSQQFRMDMKEVIKACILDNIHIEKIEGLEELFFLEDGTLDI